ncbi:MAG: transposase [Bacteroidota bacterium]
MKAQPLTPGMFYHIYNRGINGCEIFREKNDYERFLRLHDTYIDPVAETYAWALMGNHFHLVVRLKEEKNIQTLFELYGKKDIYNSKEVGNSGNDSDHTSTVVVDPVDGNSNTIKNTSTHNHRQGLQPLTGFQEKNQYTRKPKVSNQFGHLFNSYAQYYNTKYNRHGSLFERPFKRLKITSETYLRHVIMYVQNNPVHHGFCEHTIEYPWTSYLSTISKNSTNLKREEVLDLFGGKENFKYSHSICTNVFDINLE